MLEHDITHRGYYGISKRTITDTLGENKIVIKDISVKGLLNCRKQLSHKVLINSVFLTERKSVLKKRLIKRGEKNYKLRLKIYKKEQAQMGFCDYIIKNSNLLYTILIFESIIEHATNNKLFIPAKNQIQVNEKLVNKYVAKINKGKKVKPIKVALYNGEIYVLDKIEKYIASLQCGKVWSKKFINLSNFVPSITEESVKEWQNKF